jgi:DNA-binding MarR family transcriptional regulator
MRPTAHPQSALRMPLNDILATEANVRVLRVLAELTTPISPAELARRAQLQRSSVHRVIKSLEATGVIDFVGNPPHIQVALRERTPLSRVLRDLFRAERSRYEDLFSALQKTAASLEPPPVAVWILGPLAKNSDRPGDPVILCVLDNPRTISTTTERLGELLERLERKLDLTIEVRSRTTADLEERSRLDELAHALPVFGLPPDALTKRSARHARTARNVRVHAYHDERSLALGERLADELTRDPSIVSRARAYVQHRWRNASAGERKELAEWKRILDTASPARLRKLLTDPGERATRLRQTLPFLGVFSHDESR